MIERQRDTDTPSMIDWLVVKCAHRDTQHSIEGGGPGPYSTGGNSLTLFLSSQDSTLFSGHLVLVDI